MEWATEVNNLLNLWETVSVNRTLSELSKKDKNGLKTDCTLAEIIEHWQTVGVHKKKAEKKQMLKITVHLIGKCLLNSVLKAATPFCASRQPTANKSSSTEFSDTDSGIGELIPKPRSTKNHRAPDPPRISVIKMATKVNPKPQQPTMPTRHCNFCKRQGHTEMRCWDLGKSMPIPPTRLFYANNKVRFCRACLRSGHTESKCWDLGKGRPPLFYMQQKMLGIHRATIPVT